MNSAIQFDQVRQAIRETCERFRVKELLLFGSALGDDFREDSDLDLLVEFQPEVRIGLVDFLRFKDELEDLLHRRVDLVPKKSLKPLLRAQVMEKTELVYAA